MSDAKAPSPAAGADRFGAWAYTLPGSTTKDFEEYFKEAGDQVARERPRTLLLGPADLPAPPPKRRKAHRKPGAPRAPGSAPGAVAPTRAAGAPPPKKKVTIRMINRVGKVKTGIETFKEKEPCTKPDVSLPYRVSAGYIGTPWLCRERN